MRDANAFNSYINRYNQEGVEVIQQEKEKEDRERGRERERERGCGGVCFGEVGSVYVF